jgi:hypothetical protein
MEEILLPFKIAAAAIAVLFVSMYTGYLLYLAYKFFIRKTR